MKIKFGYLVFLTMFFLSLIVGNIYAQETLEADGGSVAIIPNDNEIASLLTEAVNPNAVVRPLLQTKWGQGTPYKNMLPQGHRSFCGLVAAAQIMKFHNHPVRARGQSEAYTMSNGVRVPTLNFNFTYDWSNMLNSYRSDGRDSNDKQREAVAALIYHIGVARGRDFINGNNRNSWAVVFTNYFGYDRSIQRHDRRFYTDTEWFALIRKQLDAGLPVIYAGYEPGSDHTFIIDGYDNQGRFHINWGWSGRHDGWYSLDNLNYAGSRRFYNNHNVVTNIRPDRGGTSAGADLALNNFSVSKTSVNQNEIFTVSAQIRNNSVLDTFNGGRWGVALVNNNNNIVAIIGDNNAGVRAPLASTSLFEINNCFVPDTVAQGQYRLRMAVRPEGGDWAIITKSAVGNNVPNAIPFNVTTARGTPGGGYGMGLAAFTATSTAVTRNEQFSVTFSLRNIGQETFPGGHTGVVIVDNNGNIAGEVMGVGTTQTRNSGGQTALIVRNISIPNYITPGRYQLRIVIRQTGGEWRIATLSHNNTPTGIDFTVR